MKINEIITEANASIADQLRPIQQQRTDDWIRDFKQNNQVPQKTTSPLLPKPKGYVPPIKGASSTITPATRVRTLRKQEVVKQPLSKSEVNKGMLNANEQIDQCLSVINGVKKKLPKLKLRAENLAAEKGSRLPFKTEINNLDYIGGNSKLNPVEKWKELQRAYENLEISLVDYIKHPAKYS